MLRFKDSYSYGAEIEKFGRIKRDVMDQLYRDIFTGYVFRNLPAELEKQGIETTAEQCRNQSAVIVGHYEDEFKQECRKFAQEVSDGRDPKVVISDLDEFYLGLIRKMDAELENEFGQYSDRYHNSLEDFTTQCMLHLPSETIPSNCDHRNWKLNRLLTYENFLEHWQNVFEMDDWSKAVILHEVDHGLSKDLVYDALRKSDGDLDRAAKIAASVVCEDFFVDVLANELRTVAINRVEPSDDLETLLGTVDDLVVGEFFELADSIEQRVKDLAEPMCHELNSELM